MTLKGISVSPGIAIGKVFFYLDEKVKVPMYSISEEEIANEKIRYEDAIGRAAAELTDLKARNSAEMGKEERGVLDSHILMLQDPEFAKQVEANLITDLKNVEWILHQTIEDLVDKLDNSSERYLRERSQDIRDISKRVLNHLMLRDRISLADISVPIILATHDLLPSDVLAMNKSMVKGIAMDAGGKTSHTAILARAFEIPAVLGLSRITRYVHTGEEIIVDGNAGIVIINPDAQAKKDYLSSSKRWHRREKDLLTLNELPAETLDGKSIKLMVNIEVPEETESAIAHGSDGIGLYRSEFLFLQPDGLASEERQYQAYRSVLETMGGRSVTIRTLDLGGDKVLPSMKNIDEKNPILGWRAIRFCLSKKGLFIQQLRALLRAANHGNLQIMFPMISGIEELEDALEVLEDAKESLKRDGVEVKNDIPVGIMIETPSAALTADILAKKASFFSIGTNDLIQYTLAVDRGNERIAYLYEPFHPGVIRLIQIVIKHAHNAGIPVSMCGEMAGDPLAAVILLGLGLDIFSMSAFTIPVIKKIIRSVSIRDAEDLCRDISEMRSAVEIDKYVYDWMHERFDILVS